jgi:hypothetical protein
LPGIVETPSPETVFAGMELQRLRLHYDQQVPESEQMRRQADSPNSKVFTRAALPASFSCAVPAHPTCPSFLHSTKDTKENA